MLTFLKKFSLIFAIFVFLYPSIGFAQNKIPPAAESGLALKMLKKSQPGRWEPPPQPQPEVLIVHEDDSFEELLPQTEINKPEELEKAAPNKNLTDSPSNSHLE